MRIVITVLLTVAVIVFLVQNIGATELHYLAWKAEVSLAVPVLVAYLVGGLTGPLILRYLVKQRKKPQPAQPRE